MRFVYFTKGVRVNPANVSSVCVKRGVEAVPKYDADGRHTEDVEYFIVSVNLVDGDRYYSERFAARDAAEDFAENFIHELEARA